jgi:predicted ester cyclase
LLGIPRTGKQISMTGMTIWRIADGKIVEHWSEMDTLGLLQQLGVIPMPG